MESPIFLLVILASFLFASTFANANAQSPVLTLKSGKVSGVVQKIDELHSVYAYLGIRYGKASRFAKPKPADKWSEVYEATKFRDSCPQFELSRETHWLKNYTESEDCLYLNVWRPADEKTNRTVMVFIHGGGYQTGTGFLDAQHFASQGDVIMVSLNYRLGALGFLHAGQDFIGNWGLHDQILALHWVRENIAQFGGNPHDVTIFGQSAGSWSVGSLLLSPLAKGLFKRAIMQSGSPTTAADSTSLALQKFKTFAHKVGCEWHSNEETVKCLKSKTFQQLTAASYHEYWQILPIFGDELLPIAPVEAVKSGKFNRGIDLLFGLVRDEGSILVGGFIEQRLKTSKNLSVHTIREDIELLMKQFGLSYAAEVADFYVPRIGSNSSQDQLKLFISTVAGDYFFNCPAVLFAEEIAKHEHSARYYSYRLLQTAWKPSEATRWMGVSHSSDISFIFPFESFLKYADEAARSLSRDMIRAWTSFAKTGHTTPMGSVPWLEAFPDKANPITRHMSLDSAHYKMVDAFYKQACDGFWKPKLFA